MTKKHKVKGPSNPLDNLMSSLTTRQKGPLTRSEILSLPVVQAAVQEDPEAMDYLRGWNAPVPDTIDLERANVHDLSAWMVTQYNRKVMELRKREGIA